MQGGPDIIVDGQIALAEAGHRNGVRRILPSGYALDIFEATPGEHPMSDQRVEADARIAELGIEHVHILQDAFMMMVANGFTMMPGAETAYLPSWITTARSRSSTVRATSTSTSTSVEDTARMIVRVALDRDVPSGKFAFRGDVVTWNKAIDAIEWRTAKTCERHHLGDEAVLRDTMAKAKGLAKLILPYALYMLNGQTALHDLQSDRYTDLKLETFAGYVARTMA